MKLFCWTSYEEGMIHSHYSAFAEDVESARQMIVQNIATGWLGADGQGNGWWTECCEKETKSFLTNPVWELKVFEIQPGVINI